MVHPLLSARNFKMIFLITSDKTVALVANPRTLAPRPNFTNLRALCCHLQRALQRLVDPQSNVLGWSRLVMSRPMYQMLSTSAFRLPSDPGLRAIYFGARTPKIPSLMQPSTQHMFPSLLLITPSRRRSTLILYFIETPSPEPELG